MTRAEAELQKAIEEAGGNADLIYRTDERYSSRTPGTVIEATVLDGSGDRTPLAGQQIPAGNTVFIVLAKKIPVVPNVLDEQVDRATRELEAKGYAVKVRRIVSTRPEGVVLSQSVPRGTKQIPNNKPIMLTVAKPQPGTFISVTGAGSALITWIADGSTRQVTVPLPFTTKVPSPGSFDVISMSAQRQLGDGGSITCAIIDYGDVVKKSTSSGPYSICSVTY